MIRRVALVLVLAVTGCGGLAETTARPSGLDATPSTTIPGTTDPVTTTPAPTISTTTSGTTMSGGTTSSSTTTSSTTSSSTTTSSTTITTMPPPVRSGAIVSPTPTVGDPVSIEIPSLGVSGPLVATGYLDDGTVDVPPDPMIPGWFEPGPRPGERGPAVIMGHVDSRSSGPGAFYRLRELEVGAIVTVDTTTGPVDFVVTSVEQFPKDEFPTDRVYGPVPERALRLITCGGSFDRSIRHYRDNIVAFLVPVEPT